MLNLSTSQYFSSLSEFIQESIMQSGIDFKDEEQLREFTENLKTHKCVNRVYQ